MDCETDPEQVKVYQTAEGDVVVPVRAGVEGTEVLYTNASSREGRILPDTPKRIYTINESLVVNWDVGDESHGIGLHPVRDRVVPFEDYQRALAQARPLQEAYNAQVMEISRDRGPLKLCLHPTEEDKAHNRKEKGEFDARIAELKPVPSLLDILDAPPETMLYDVDPETQLRGKDEL